MEGKRLLDRVRDKIRVKHYSIRTEDAYMHWVKRFVLFHQKRHPKDMGTQEVEAFLSQLTVAGKVSASTQNQAKAALLFLYKEVRCMRYAVQLANVRKHATPHTLRHSSSIAVRVELAPISDVPRLWSVVFSDRAQSIAPSTSNA